MIFTIEFFRIRPTDDAHATLDRLSVIVDDLDAAKVNFETLEIPRSPTDCASLMRVDVNCFSGINGKTMPRGPKGDMIGNAVQVMKILTGEIEESVQADDGKNKAAQELGRMGGKARAEGTSAKRRKEIARQAEWGQDAQESRYPGCRIKYHTLLGTAPLTSETVDSIAINPFLVGWLLAWITSHQNAWYDYPCHRWLRMEIAIFFAAIFTAAPAWAQQVAPEAISGCVPCHGAEGSRDMAKCLFLLARMRLISSISCTRFNRASARTKKCAT